MSGLEVFSYADVEVRTVMIDGEPWFVLSDLCDVLGIANIGNVADRIDPLSIRSADVQNSRGQMRATLTVSEAGMYEVVIRSDKPQAAAFRRWITSEVLPALRRTGTYSVPQPREQLLAAAVIEANTVIQEAHAAIATLTPRAEAWDELADAEGDYSVADAASILVRCGVQTGPQRLFRTLADMRWIYRGEGGRWRPYANRLDAGHLCERAQPPRRGSDGELVPVPPQVRVTARGLERLRVVLGEIKADAA